jgi:hypothetical protein
MPRENFISLGGLGNWLRHRGYSQNHIFELLRKGELKTVIQHPAPLQPFPIALSEWQKIDYADFQIEQYSPDGRRRTGKRFYIDDGFAYDWTISRLVELLSFAKSEDRSLLDFPGVHVYLPVEIRKNDAVAPDWQAIHHALVEWLVRIMQERQAKIAQQGSSRSQVFVLSSDFDDFKTAWKIKAVLSTAGRKRIAKKDNIWAEILKRYYTIHTKDIVAKNRATDIVSYARKDLNFVISQQAVEDIVRVIDELSVDVGK